MGLIGQLLNMVFGGGRNVVAETAEVFRENAEAGAVREADLRSQTMVQFAGEFAPRQRGWFDRLMDGVNRLPRPAMALGTMGMFVSAMTNPIWFAERMQGIALVPEPLWWLLGAIVSFYFGARHQLKGQEFQHSLAATMSRLPKVVDNIEKLRKLRADSPGAADTGPDAALTLASVAPGENAALFDWRHARG
ncbi:holin family protein [uncultured Roseovarius sp.]|uniref:holin family protein n=1 Tax=uncultured Roseovarius sp. TaxID=293344 RepID=UPI00261F1BA4|nr:holin family protein [uncultured Roseovarius sp.]